jgi:carboxyl-terminal processing protease
MLSRLKQSHFVLMPGSPSTAEPPLGSAVVAVDVRMTAAGAIITNVARGSTAEKAGLRAGQRLVSVDDKPVGEPASTDPAMTERERRYHAWTAIVRALHGAPESKARLRVSDVKGRVREITVTRGTEPGERIALGNLPPLNLTFDSRELRTPGKRTAGLIAFSVWMAAIDGPLSAAVDRFRRADALIIDLRGNPGGLAPMIRGVAGHLMTAPQVLGRMQTRDATLEFAANPRLSTADGRRVEPFGGPVAVLVDEMTASASERFAGGLQSLGRARIIGRPTMGAALPASTRRLADGDVLMYALGDFVTATGRRIEGQGVEPDERVPLDEAGIKALAEGRDPVLEAALKWVDRVRTAPLALAPASLLSSRSLQARHFLPH